MLNIPEEVKTLFSTDGVNKNFHVHFPNGETSDLNNENILSESVKFTESLCSQQYFKFGLAEASQIEFTAVGIPNILGAVIDCAMEIDCTSLGSAWAEQNPIDTTLDFLEPQTCEYNSKIYYRIPYGRFVVDSCPRNHGAMAQRKITAYSENPLDREQFIKGQFTRSKLEIDLLQWMDLQSLPDSEMTEVPLLSSYSTTLANISTDPLNLPQTSNGSDAIMEFIGVGLARRTLGSRYTPRIVTFFNTAQNKKIAFRARFSPHDFDNYGVSLHNAVMASFPNTEYTYNDISVDTTSQSYRKMYSSNAQMWFSTFCAFSPSVFVEERWINSGETRAIYRYSKPIFIEADETYIFDLGSSFDFFSKIPSGYSMDYVALYAFIPVKWASTASVIRDPGSEISVQNWESSAPFDGQSLVERNGNVSVFYKQITEDSSPLKITVNSTLKFSKCSGSGNYYTYANAVSMLGILGGLMELKGEFWKIYRTGVHNFFKISDNQTLIPVSRSDWEEFWWDENDVDPIGTVNAKFSDGENSGEESLMSFSIGDGASIYTMENNVVLENSTATQDELQAVIDQYFAPNASVINFTPVDLGMRGLPYLETGDYIQLTAEDGTTVNTYILEQTINGIQHLTADITSTNGELLEVMENE